MPVRSPLSATAIGQCQRYTPYEMRPTQRTGASDNAALSGLCVVCTIAATTIAVHTAKTRNPP
jgi:hypothetical protein